MRGRAWSRGAIQLEVEINAPALHKGRWLNDYVDGVMDTLDGSHGVAFTYLPVVYEDDCQVCVCRYKFTKSTLERYRVRVVFLES